MTKDEALKLALEALKTSMYPQQKQLQAITAIKEALAQPAQEPVAWGVFEGNLHDIFFTQAEAQKMAELKGSHAKVRPLYTATQPAQEPDTNEETVTYVADVLAGKKRKEKNT